MHVYWQKTPELPVASLPITSLNVIESEIINEL